MNETRSAGTSPDLLVVGGGSAGFAAAIRGAALGAEVLLVERGTMGGTCVNRGCVPSKTLIRAAELHHLRTGHPFRGLPRGDGSIDFSDLVAQKDELVTRLRGAKYRDILAAYPSVAYEEGRVRFVSSDAVEVAASEGGSRRLEPDAIVLATGASPWIPPVPGLAEVPYWTSADALDAEELPGRLLVIGGSAVGTELAQTFSRLGSRVTIVEALPALVPAEDPELGAALADAFREEGIEVRTGAKAVRAAPDAGGDVRLWIEAGGQKKEELRGDRILVATGRRANNAALDPEAAGLAIDERGFIEVDAGMRTNVPGVYAAGDCTPLPQFVYVAARAGTVAAENALGSANRTVDLSAMPAVTFTDPQVASVGLGPDEAEKRHGSVRVRTLEMREVPRALANRDTRGLVKLVVREEDGRIVGVHVLSPRAGELIQTGVLAVKHGLTVDDLTDTLFPYLTEVEGLKLAAQTFTKEVGKLSCCAG